ncbi:unknown [Bacteroides sp. CAG:1060]|nr:unknown [Bacteroides sp. CAG:1060]
MRDILAIEKIVAPYLRYLSIHLPGSLSDTASFAYHHHNPATGCHQIAILESGAHVEHLTVHQLDAFNHGTLLIFSRITLGCQDNSHRHSLFPPKRLRSTGYGYGLENIVRITFKQRQHNFRFRIAETGIELYNLDSVRGLHKTSIEHTGKRTPFGTHGFRRRHHYLLKRIVPVLLRNERKSRIGTHAAGIRPQVPVKSPFVVLRQRHRIHILSIHKTHERKFRTSEEILHNHLAFSELFFKKHHP